VGRHRARSGVSRAPKVVSQFGASASSLVSEKEIFTRYCADCCAVDTRSIRIVDDASDVLRRRRKRALLLSFATHPLHHLLGKRGVDKKPFELPDFIQATGIAKL
jgi:hypothetical protein